MKRIAQRVSFQFRLAQAAKRDAKSPRLPTLWYENKDGQRWVPDFDKEDGTNPPPGYHYQWSRNPLTLQDNCLKINTPEEVAACPHPEEDIRKTYGWIDGVEGRECARCKGSQTKNVSDPWPDKWDSSGSYNLMSGNSGYSADLVLALSRPSPAELLKAFERGYVGSPVVFELADAVILAASGCERCMNALAYRYGLDWGYARGSKDWDAAGTTCFICRRGPRIWEMLERGKR